MSLSQPVAAYDDDEAFKIANGRHIVPDDLQTSGGPTKCHLNIHEAEKWDPYIFGGMRIRTHRIDYKFANFPHVRSFTT